MKRSTGLQLGIAVFIALQIGLVVTHVPIWVDLVGCGVFANNVLWFAILKQAQNGYLQTLGVVGQVADNSSNNMTTVAMGGLQVANTTLQVNNRDLQKWLAAGAIQFDQQGLATLPDGTRGQIEII